MNIVCDNAIDDYTRQRALTVLSEHGFTGTVASTESKTLSNIYLGVAGTNGLAKAAATKLGLDLSVLTKSGKFDRHVLSLTGAANGVAQLIIIGENTDATFMGLASLEQMLDATTTAMPTVTISDYADLKERGIIEGFYGKPYSCEVRKDLLRFMMRNKMNCYVYGPKSDVYHSGKWDEAYPTTLTESQRKSGFVTQQDLREFTSVAHQTKVSVVWAIHPGESLLEDNDVVSRLWVSLPRCTTSASVSSPSLPTMWAFPAPSREWNSLQHAYPKYSAAWKAVGTLPAPTPRYHQAAAFHTADLLLQLCRFGMAVQHILQDSLPCPPM